MKKTKLYDLVILDHDFRGLQTLTDVLAESITIAEADRFVFEKAGIILGNTTGGDYDLLLVDEYAMDLGDGTVDIDSPDFKFKKLYNLEPIIKKKADIKELYS